MQVGRLPLGRHAARAFIEEADSLCMHKTNAEKPIKGKGLTEAESSQLGNACRS
jgi:hypothetical protein